MKNYELFSKTSAYDLLIQMNENLRKDNFIARDGCCVLNCFLREDVVHKRCKEYDNCQNCIQQFLQEDNIPMDNNLTGDELDKLGIHICNREFGTGNSIINEVKPQDRKLIDLNALEPDSGWDDYYDGFTTYSKLCLESAEVIDCEPIVYADWVLRQWADCTCSNCGYNCGVSELKTPRCAWCGVYMMNWQDDEDEHGAVHIYEEL